MLKIRTAEFEIGKRHLAKMMGENADTFTQQDVNRAIAYLLPSGLSEPKARPFLKHPEEYIPKNNIASFGNDGRPLHFLFYTGNSEFYQLTYDIVKKILDLNKLEEATYVVSSKLRIQSEEEVSTKMDISGGVWIDRFKLSKLLNATVDEFSYAKFLVLIQKLANHPMSKRQEEFIKKFLIPFEPPITLNEIPAVEMDKSNRAFRTFKTKLRTAIASVKMTEGTGRVTIIDHKKQKFDISYFALINHREQLLFPFKVVDKINKFDLDIRVNAGGMSRLAKAIRFSISNCLCSFISTEQIEKLRLAGLLERETRTRERKKYGQEGARRKYTWKRR